MGRLSLSRVALVVFSAFLLDSGVAFEVTAPDLANADAPVNISANWTWFRGDPTKVLIHLFVSLDDVCVFGRATPLQSKGIQYNITETEENSDGKKDGVVIYNARPAGQYILCAYEDISQGEPLNLRSIANSGVFEVGRPAASSSNAQDKTDQGRSSPSPGIIAGAVVGALALSVLVAVGFLVYRKKRQAKARAEFISPYPDINNSTITPGRKGQRVEVLPQETPSNRREKQNTRWNTPEVQDTSSAAVNNKTPPSRRQRERVVYHNDSGWRPLARRSEEETVRVIEMPPRYDAAVIP